MNNKYDDYYKKEILYYKSIGYTPKIIADLLVLEESYVLHVMLSNETKRIFKENESKKT